VERVEGVPAFGCPVAAGDRIATGVSPVLVKHHSTRGWSSQSRRAIIREPGVT
jgi:hypothetical protein